MTILVTGATGFVGLRLCEKLRELGHDIRATLRPRVHQSPKDAALAGMGVQTVMLDLRDSAAVYQAMEGVEIVFHMAWQSNRLSQGGAMAGRTEMDAAAEANLAAMETMIGCARSAAVERFVFTSTVSTYGPTPDWGPLPRKEKDARSDLDSHRIGYFRSYAGAKYRAEQMLKSAFPPPDYVIIRPSMVYGANAQFAAQFVEAARNGGGAGDTAHPIQWIHVDDLVESLILASTKEAAKQNIYNIAGATAVLNHTVAAEVQYLVNVSTQSPNPSALDWSGRVPQYDISAAERDLEFRPRIEWKQGLREMVAAELD